MKKVVVLLMLLALIAGLFALNVQAKENYWELFEDGVNALSELHDAGRDPASWSANDIAYVTAGNLDDWMDYYNVDKATEWEDCYSIPAATFEALANKLFDVKVDLKTANSRQMFDVVYDAATQTYDIITYPRGGGAYYELYGYSESAGVYTIYATLMLDGEVYEGQGYAKLTAQVIDGGKLMKYLTYEVVETAPDKAALDVIAPPPTTTTTTTTTSAPTTTTTASTTASTAAPTTTTAEVTTTTTENTSDESSTAATTTTTTTTVMQTLADTDYIKLEADADVFPADVVVTVKTYGDEEVTDTVKTALKDKAEAFVAYEITVTSDNVTVQPNGTVQASFAVPAHLDINNVTLFYVSPDGITEEIAVTVDKDLRQVTAQLSHFSTYVVAEKAATADGAAPFDATTLYILIGIGALAIVGITVIVVLRKKMGKTA